MRMGPAERLDVVVDFAGKLGQNIYLTDLLTGMPLLEFRVTQHLVDDSTIPPTLRPLPDIGEPTVTRNWSFDKTVGHWTINGLRFDPNRVDARPGTWHNREVGLYKSYRRKRIPCTFTTSLSSASVEMEGRVTPTKR